MQQNVLHYHTKLPSRFKSDANGREEKSNEGKQNTDKLFEIGLNSLNCILLKNGKDIKHVTGVFDDGDSKLLQIHYYRLLSCDILRKCMN